MIKEFKGEYRFLSNFYPCSVQFEDAMYPSSEHAYMAAKTTDTESRKQIAALSSPAMAKRAGRALKLRDGWEAMKEEVMFAILMDKFTRNSVLGVCLVATCDAELVEGNWWGDKIWGVCLKTGVGKNLLGKTLMRVRDELRGKPAPVLDLGLE